MVVVARAVLAEVVVAAARAVVTEVVAAVVGVAARHKPRT